MSKRICCPGTSLPFCLGMTDYNCCGIPEPKRKKLSLSKKKPELEKPKPLSPSTCFNTTVSSEEIEKFSKGCVPVGTAKGTNWVIRTFQQWLMQRNKRAPQEAFPQDILQKEYPTETLCNCLQCFVSEARRVDGTQYPPSTLYQILCGLLWYSNNCQLDPLNFLIRRDACFKKLHGTCDTVFRSLCEAGVGTMKRSAQTFQSDDEDKLWESNVFNTSTAEGLQNTVFFYVGKVCCLRGGQG